MPSLTRSTLIACFFARPLYQPLYHIAEEVGVFLKCPRKLSAGQLLHIDIALGVRIGRQGCLGARGDWRHCEREAGGDQKFTHVFFPWRLTDSD